MAAQDETALEREQQVLPDRLDAEERSPVEPLGHTCRRGARVRRLDLDPLADERLQPPRGAVKRVPLRHRSARIGRMRVRAAAAGSAAAVVWAAQEPLDRRVFDCDYSDAALLGKAVTRGPHWRAAGLVLHALNGAGFGLAFDAARRRLPVRPTPLAVGLALAENTALWPFSALVDRYHPARGEPGLPPLLTNRRAFAQACWRHALFGWVLARLASV